MNVGKVGAALSSAGIELYILGDCNIHGGLKWRHHIMLRWTLSSVTAHASRSCQLNCILQKKSSEWVKKAAVKVIKGGNYTTYKNTLHFLRIDKIRNTKKVFTKWEGYRHWYNVSSLQVRMKKTNVHTVIQTDIKRGSVKHVHCAQLCVCRLYKKTCRGCNPVSRKWRYCDIM